MTAKILLVEDDRGLGETLQERLSLAGYETIWVNSIRGATAALLQNQFQLLILDVGLPDGSGFDLAREVTKSKDIPILFCTARSTAEDRLEGYEIGAVEFIPKPFHLRELMLRVEHTLSNHSVKKLLDLGGATLDVSSMSLQFEDGRSEILSLRDFKLLKLLIDKSPEILSRDSILNRLWGEDKFPTNRTVDNSILRLRQSLGPELGLKLRSVRGVGYQWNTKGEHDE